MLYLPAILMRITLKPNRYRQLMTNDLFKKPVESVDIILGPTTPTAAFKLGEKTRLNSGQYVLMRIFTPFNEI